MVSMLQYLKSHVNDFDILEFFKEFAFSTEDECRKGFKEGLELMSSTKNEERFEGLKQFAATHESNNLKILNSEECTSYYESLKAKGVLKDYEAAAWAREQTAANKSVDVAIKLRKIAQRTFEGTSQEEASSDHNGKTLDELFNEEDEVVTVKQTEPDDFKKAVFKAGYQYFKGETSLQIISLLHQLRKGFNPTTFAEYLDVLSYELLIKEMSTNEKNVLKLSLSHIISFVEPTAAIFKDFFTKQDPATRRMFEQEESKSPVLPSGLAEKSKETIDELLGGDENKDMLKIRLKISEKRTELLRTACEEEKEKEKKEEEEVLQVLDIMDFVVMNTKRKSLKHTSELSCYRTSAHIFDLMFNNTTIQMIDGENCSHATKTAQQDNRKICSDADDVKKLIGRKIDLIMATCGIELSSSEWKKDQTTSTTIEQQRIKNFRTNCAMLNKLYNLPLKDEEKAFVSIFGLDWIGMIGCMYAIGIVDDVFSIRYAGDLIVPETLGTLCNIKDTLDMLYSFKRHHQNLAKLIEPAVEKLNLAERLRKLRPEVPSHHKREIDRVVFFTPISKRQKKSNNVDFSE